MILIMDLTLKIIVVGDPSVGKTSFVARYIKHMFKTDYKSTIGVDFSVKNVKWSEDVRLRLQFWDIAGQDRYTNLTRVYFQQSDACIIMFDITRENSFKSVSQWKDDLDSKCHLSDGSPIPTILLANKCDLRATKVPKEDIDRVCKTKGCFTWYEVSVLENYQVDQSMKALLKEIMATHERLEGKTITDQTGKNIKLEKAESEENNCKC